MREAVQAMASRLRSRKLPPHLPPAEELLKQQEDGVLNSETTPSISHMDLERLSIAATIPGSDHHRHRHDEGISRDTLALHAPMSTRSKSKGKPFSAKSSIRQSAVGVSTLRALPYASSGDDLPFPDSGGAYATDSQSSSQTLDQEEHASDIHEDTGLSLPFFENEKVSLTKDAFFYLLYGLLVLAFGVVVAVHADVLGLHQLINHLERMHVLSLGRPRLVQLRRVPELKEHLMDTVRLCTEKLQESVERMEAEIRKETNMMKKEMSKKTIDESGTVRGEHQTLKDASSTLEIGHDIVHEEKNSASVMHALVEQHLLTFKPTSSEQHGIGKVLSFNQSNKHPICLFDSSSMLQTADQCLLLAASKYKIRRRNDCLHPSPF